MTSYIKFVHEYSKQDLLDLFNNSEKKPPDISGKELPNYASTTLAVLGEDSFNLEKLSPFFETFSFIPKNDDSLALSKFLNNTSPFINLRNNGFLIFPVSGSLTLNNYNYIPETESNGRPFIDILNMSESEIEDIEATKTESVIIDSPIAIDGLTTYSLHVTEPNTVTLVLKIPLSTSWESVLEFLKSK
jgi:hypothetical protein